MLPQGLDIIAQPIPCPFVGNWDIQQGSQCEVKIGDRSHFYFLFRDRPTNRIMLQVGRCANSRYYVLEPQSSMYEVLLLHLGDQQWSAGADDALLVMSVGRMFREDRHGSIDVVAA